jgi:hypothetical protein
MADEKEVKKLSGESRVDALVLELKHKFGFHTSEAVLADAPENDEAREAVGLAKKEEEKPEEKEVEASEVHPGPNESEPVN